jgi:hypothetical protein
MNLPPRAFFVTRSWAVPISLARQAVTHALVIPVLREKR